MFTKQYLIKCTEEEREQIKLLTSQLKTKSDDRVAEVIIKALKRMKEGKK